MATTMEQKYLKGAARTAALVIWIAACMYVVSFVTFACRGREPSLDVRGRKAYAIGGFDAELRFRWGRLEGYAGIFYAPLIRLASLGGYTYCPSEPMVEVVPK